MTLAHNNFIRLLNSIYLQASGVKNEKDIIDFLFFCHAWCVMLHEHHGAEEKDFFPRLDEACGEKNVMGHSAEQHGEFTPKINEMHEYVQTVSAQEYSAQKLRAFIDEFGPALRKHLGEEPIALLELGEKFGGEKLAKVWDDFEKKLLAEDLKTWDKVRNCLPLHFMGLHLRFEQMLTCVSCLCSTSSYQLLLAPLTILLKEESMLTGHLSLGLCRTLLDLSTAENMLALGDFFRAG